MTDGRIGVAIAGATGAVGQRFIQFLHDHPTFRIAALAASPRSAGRPYGDATNWILDTPMPAAVTDRVVVGLEDVLQDRDVRVVFSALPSDAARDLEPRYAAAGKAVFTNASPHRMTAGVPLLIPEVNPDHLDMVRDQATFADGGGFIVANGNCSGIILTLALAPLHRAFGLDTVHVTTLQGLSGAGYPGVSALDVVDNVVPYIGGEEDKLVEEPQKTLGAGDGGAAAADFTVWPTCTRVPVREGHLESVHVTLRTDAAEDAILAALRDFRGPDDIADLPHAPASPIHVTDEADRPQPRRDRDNGNGMAVTVGRIRVDGARRIRFLVLGHNTVRGAAGQSVLNAEYAAAKGLL